MSNSESVFIVFVTFELLIPAAGSLKTKRSAVKSTKERVKNKFNAAVAEIGYHDKLQRAAIGVTMLGNSKQKLQQDISRLELMLREQGEVPLNDFRVEWL